MKKIITFAVAFIALFSVSMELYSDEPPVEPNYYCKYIASEGRCIVGDGDPCYGIDGDCNWLE